MTVSGSAAAPDAERSVPARVPLDLPAILGIHARGRGDPTLRLEGQGRAWRATRTGAGPATLLVERTPDGVRAMGWGPGAAAAVAGVEALLGLEDDPSRLIPRHPVLADAERLPGLRIGRTGPSSRPRPGHPRAEGHADEARRAFRALVARTASRRRDRRPPVQRPGGARGPALLRVPPARLERRRAELIRAAPAGRRGSRRRGAVVGSGDLAPAYAALRAFPASGRGRRPRSGSGRFRRSEAGASGLPPAGSVAWATGSANRARPTSACWSCWSPLPRTARPGGTRLLERA